MKLISDPPPRSIIRPNQIDNVAEAVLALTRELWVLTDRLAVVEAVLERRGGLSAEEVERFTPDAAQEAALAARRQRLIEVVEAALTK